MFADFAKPQPFVEPLRTRIHRKHPEGERQAAVGRRLLESLHYVASDPTMLKRRLKSRANAMLSTAQAGVGRARHFPWREPGCTLMTCPVIDAASSRTS